MNTPTEYINVETLTKGLSDRLIARSMRNHLIYLAECRIFTGETCPGGECNV